MGGSQSKSQRGSIVEYAVNLALAVPKVAVFTTVALALTTLLIVSGFISDMVDRKE